MRIYTALTPSTSSGQAPNPSPDSGEGSLFPPLSPILGRAREGLNSYLHVKNPTDQTPPLH